jgi:hypothetical protein
MVKLPAENGPAYSVFPQEEGDCKKKNIGTKKRKKRVGADAEAC